LLEASHACGESCGPELVSGFPALEESPGSAIGSERSCFAFRFHAEISGSALPAATALALIVGSGFGHVEVGADPSIPVSKNACCCPALDSAPPFFSQLGESGTAPAGWAMNPQAATTAKAKNDLQVGFMLPWSVSCRQQIKVLLSVEAHYTVEQCCR
jgi:hypothetical protein